MGFYVLDQIVFDPQLTFPVGLNWEKCLKTDVFVRNVIF